MEQFLTDDEVIVWGEEPQPCLINKIKKLYKIRKIII